MAPSSDALTIRFSTQTVVTSSLEPILEPAAAEEV
eukprot:CAMPEP_0171973010 /NCGR_PEP_ID=MMETSP0993-20121228/225626_1 /TAXON_ID=483369 /ORGANISM="non described non described, Strain CCMP2098" /LENGTH=34 /DNA_ID= /DNA_START= /DNA_END= /DNA_ORIENTATION=